MDLWTRLVTVPTPDASAEAADADVVVEAAPTPQAVAAGPTETPTPEPQIISADEIASIQASAEADIAQEAAQASPVLASVQTGRLGSAVPDRVRRWESLIMAASTRFQVDPNLIAAVIMTESNGHDTSVSSAGAVGLMQVVGGSSNPADNIRLGTSILARNLRLYDGRVDLALAGYNAGNGAVAKWGGIPPYRETRDYVFRVLLRYELYKSG
jgi:soluble lytic murein transglycosylase-like protein